MIFADPAPSEDVLSCAYGLPQDEYDQFFGTSYLDTKKILDGTADWQKKRACELMDQLEKIVPQRGSLFELGCGPGWLLDEANRRGWKTAGIDPGNWIHDNDHDRKLNISRCNLFDINEIQQHDLVFMSSVLEHLYDPAKYLTRLMQLKKRSGYLIIASLPNIRSFTITLGVDNWIGNHPPLHLQYFTKKTISLLLKQFGCSDIKCRSYGISETILDRFYNKELKHSGSYTGRLYMNTCYSKVLRILRNGIYTLTDIFNCGSVIDVIAR